MRRAIAIALVAATGCLALADDASAFHGKHYRYVVGPAPCSPYTYLFYPVYRPGTHCYRHQIKKAARYNAALLASGYGCGNAACGYGYGGCGSAACGYGGCGYGDGGYACGYGGCGGGCGDGGCYGGCGDGGCAGGCVGGCVGGGCDSGTTIGESGGEVLYDGPAPGSTTTEPSPDPAGDSSASVNRPTFRLTANRTSEKANGAAAFDRGIRQMRDGSSYQALESFQEAAGQEPENALYCYFQALVMHDTQGADAAQGMLQQALELEKQNPVANWGKRMERVQGRNRLWIEKARRDAGLVR